LTHTLRRRTLDHPSIGDRHGGCRRRHGTPNAGTGPTAWDLGGMPAGGGAQS